MKLLATRAFNCIVLMIKFGLTSCEDILPALLGLWLALLGLIASPNSPNGGLTCLWLPTHPLHPSLPSHPPPITCHQ